MVVYTFNAGHGLGTAGKRSPDDEREWSFNNIICTAAINEIKKYAGVTVIRADDQTGKTDVGLITRTNKALAAKSKRYISFHNNALYGRWGSHGGTETLIHPQTSADNKALAQKIQNAQVGVTNLRDRGVKTRTNLHELNVVGVSSIILETAFMDSTTDIKVLRDRAKLEAVGRAVAQTIAKHDGLKLKAGETITVTPPKKEEKPVAKKDDVKGHWAEAHIEKMIKTGAMTRDKDGQFNPNGPLTRAQLCAILDRLKLI